VLKTFKRIAKFYGFTVRTSKQGPSYFYFETGVIVISDDASCKASVFCHELAHGLRCSSKKPSIYYNDKSMKKYFGTVKGARIALNEEIKTDKLGKQLCQIWFPKKKFRGYYKDNMECLAFLYGAQLKDIGYI
jgi:hypothetical protein